MQRFTFITAIATAAAGLTTAASAATINPGPAVVGNGNGTVSTITITGAPGNDNVTTSSNPNVQINGKNFTAVGPIDIVFATTDTLLTSEYLVAEGVTNSTGVAWSGFVIELGFGSGGSFVPSLAGDGLDFDFPTYDPAPSAGASFSTVLLGEDALAFSSGLVPSGNAIAFNFSIDVPDGLAGDTFTLRQTPIPVPEPGTLGGLIAAGALTLLARCRQRNRKP